MKENQVGRKIIVTPHTGMTWSILKSTAETTTPQLTGQNVNEQLTGKEKDAQLRLGETQMPTGFTHQLGKRSNGLRPATPGQDVGHPGGYTMDQFNL